MEISKQEIEAIIRLSPEKRYAYLIGSVYGHYLMMILSF